MPEAHVCECLWRSSEILGFPVRSPTTGIILVLHAQHDELATLRMTCRLLLMRPEGTTNYYRTQDLQETSVHSHHESFAMP